MDWSAWRDWVIAALAAVATALSAYWRAAPELLRFTAGALGPLLMLEATSAVWMQWAAKRPRAEPIDVTIYPGDTWTRAGERFGLTLALVCLAGAVDVLLGTRYMTVLWVLLWGTAGHARATLRHLETVAQLRYMHLPIFPEGRMSQLDALARTASNTNGPIGRDEMPAKPKKEAENGTEHDES